MMEDYEDDLERLAAAGLCGGRRSSTVSRSGDTSASKNYSPCPQDFPQPLRFPSAILGKTVSRACTCAPFSKCHSPYGSVSAHRENALLTMTFYFKEKLFDQSQKVKKTKGQINEKLRKDLFVTFLHIELI